MLLKRNRAHSLGQLERLVILLVYVGLFLLVSWILDERFPPFGNQGIWFYSSAVAVLLVSLLVTPFSDRPVDVVSSAVAAILTLLVANTWEAQTSSYVDRVVWIVVIGYVSFVLLVALLAITFYNFETREQQKITGKLYPASINLGTPTIIFSAVFCFAVVSFHRGSVREWVILGCAWFIFILLCPVEVIWRQIKKTTGIEEKFNKGKRLGYIAAHKSPNIILVKIDAKQNVKFGDLLLARNELGEASYAMALDYIGYSRGRWLRGYIISFPSISTSAVGAVKKNQISRGNVYKANMEHLTSSEQQKVSDLRDRIVGLVSSNSTSGMLRVEVVRDDIEIRQGSIFELNLQGKSVEYQVVEGITQEEIIERKNAHGYIFARAKIIGSWDEKNGRYVAYSWVPNQNQIVLAKESEMIEFDSEFIGYVSYTNNGVSLKKINKLVTHNAAVLGVLGSGKSYFAFELIERILAKEIKVICIDLSGEYQNELAELYDPLLDTQLISELEVSGPAGKTKYSYIQEEGGSVVDFEKALKDSYSHSLGVQDSNLRIFDPSQFEVWAQKSWIYGNGRATMSQLTYPEIVSKLTMVILEIAKQSGMTKAARYCIIFEEAHSLIPELISGVSTEDKSAVVSTSSAILQGRKFGLGCLVVTQRTANVAKSILNQCNTIFSLRVFDNTAMDFLENYFGKDYASSLSSLEDRHAVMYGIASSCQVPIQVKLNERKDFLRVFRQNQAINLP